jgi:hypothetical protein
MTNRTAASCPVCCLAACPCQSNSGRPRCVPRVLGDSTTGRRPLRARREAERSPWQSRPNRKVGSLDPGGSEAIAGLPRQSHPERGVLVLAPAWVAAETHVRKEAAVVDGLAAGIWWFWNLRRSRRLPQAAQDMNSNFDARFVDESEVRFQCCPAPGRDRGCRICGSRPLASSPRRRPR